MDYLTHLSYSPYERSTMTVHICPMDKWLPMRKPRPVQSMRPSTCIQQEMELEALWTHSLLNPQWPDFLSLFSPGAALAPWPPQRSGSWSVSIQTSSSTAWAALIHLLTLPHLAHMFPWSPMFLDSFPVTSQHWPCSVTLLVCPCLLNPEMLETLGWVSHLLSSLSTHSLSGFL